MNFNQREALKMVYYNRETPQKQHNHLNYTPKQTILEMKKSFSRKNKKSGQQKLLVVML